MKEKHHYPSFSASLLEKIYRSIDEAEANADELKFRKQSKSNARSSKVTADPQMWHISPEQGKTSKNHQDRENSWDSNPVRFSSSDTESMFGAKRHTFTPPFLPRPKPVRTSVSDRSEKVEEKQRTLSYERKSRTELKQSTLSYEQRRPFDDYSPNPSSEDPQEEGLARVKSRALKIYGNLKQPISPGGRFVSFINSLFTPNVKKTKNSDSLDDINNNTERNPKSEKVSTCPSPCSFSTSCLSKTSPERPQKFPNVPQRSVRFQARSNAVIEEQKPCPIKALYGQGSSISNVMRPPVSTIVSGGRSYPHTFDVRKRHVKSRRRIEAAVGDLFKDYDEDDDDVDDDDDDASSCSSSDLFELDGLTVLASDSRYSKELPVYETTRFELGRNMGYLANGFIF